MMHVFSRDLTCYNEQLQRDNEWVVCRHRYSEVITESLQICNVLTAAGGGEHVQRMSSLVYAPALKQVC